MIKPWIIWNKVFPFSSILNSVLLSLSYSMREINNNHVGEDEKQASKLF
jgi:hypothetical protein